MRNFIKAALITGAMTIPSMALACPGNDDCACEAKKDSKHAKKQESKSKIQQLSVKEAAKLRSEGKIIMVDANQDDTRKKEGYVPGARLLSHYKNYDDKELKASKKDTLVFYCGSEKCTAAPKAAEIAKAKGYQVKVMHAGIKGWMAAGYETKKL